MRDIRDPIVLGQSLLNLKAESKLKRLHKVYDRYRDILQGGPVFHDPQSSLERYGDPVALHKAKIAAGLAVELP